MSRMVSSPHGWVFPSRREIVKKYLDEPCGSCGAPRRVVSGDWLREQRERAGLTLREMARRLDFSAPYICDVEKNRRHCSPKIRAAYEALVSH